MKTEKVIQDGIKNDITGVKNDVEDKLEKGVSALSVGQGELENRPLRLEAAKTAAGPPARLQEMTAPLGTPSTPPERRQDGQTVCWQCGKPSHIRRECRKKPYEKLLKVSGARRGLPVLPHSPPCFTLNVLARGTEDSLIAEGWIQEIGRCTLKIWVFVAYITDEFILGLDILRAYDATVDVGRHGLRLGHEEVPVRKVRTSSVNTVRAYRQPQEQVAGMLAVRWHWSSQEGVHGGLTVQQEEERMPADDRWRRRHPHHLVSHFCLTKSDGSRCAVQP
jgi:hypothetical protein